MHRVVALALVVVALPLAACGGSVHDVMGHDGSDMAHDGMTHSPAQMGTGRNADVMFTQEMIPHHQQAVAMADLALDPAHEASPAVKDLATRIKTAQTAEIADMNAWLEEWGADPVSGQMMDHSAMGMMSSADMTALADAKGSAFDRLWLEGMILHHQGALTMASHIAERGDDPRVQTLSAAIEKSQAAEISEMKQLLGQ
ncbi:MAG: DUF305 domain-containing protein [Gaiellales bacterium]